MSIVCVRVDHTINPQDQRRRRSLNAAFGDSVGDYTRVVPHIRGFHLCDVKVACLLGHKSARVLDDKRRVLIEDPCEGKFCEQNQKTTDLSNKLKFEQISKSSISVYR